MLGFARTIQLRTLPGCLRERERAERSGPADERGQRAGGVDQRQALRQGGGRLRGRQVLNCKLGKSHIWKAQHLVTAMGETCDLFTLVI